ncbi:hypothetical protein HK103_004319 [Boothiomyces macroporosus]|uniref:Uncharacterized protein n=1 Tax=Boothiomyces macroporosus TaxID=261099 RepID=A0AAD5Y8D2_9FUNG|nr:hypothetical protein HK103_004319 [Boothiomyces macroporosus]
MKLLLVSKEWSRAFATAIYQNPDLTPTDAFERLLGLLNTPLPTHPYSFMIQKLDISGIAADNLYMGDLDACLKQCANIKILRLERCFHISNILLQSISNYCFKIEQLDLPGCPISDRFVPLLAKNCQMLKKIDFSFTNMTVTALYHLIANCPSILEIDLSECKQSEGLPEPLVRNFQSTLTYLNLRNSPVTDTVMRYVASQCPKLKTLILESCLDLTDASLMKVANSCPDLVTLDLSFCDMMTDLSLQVFSIRASSDKGGNLQQELHLAACDQITPSAVHQLVKKCANLELLVLDGCDKITNSYIKPHATFKEDDITCTFELPELRKLADLSIEEAKVTPADSYNTPPTTPPRVNVSFDPYEITKTEDENYKRLSLSIAKNPSGLSRKKSRSLLSRRSMINMVTPLDAENFVEAAFEDRAQRIRHKRLSKVVSPVSETPSIENSIEKARRISVRRSMNDLSIKSTKFVPTNTPVQENLKTNTSWISNSTYYDSKSNTPAAVESKLDWNKPTNPTPRPMSVTAAAFTPANAQPTQTLLASGRRLRHQSMTNSIPKSVEPFTPTPVTTPPPVANGWGADPQVWNNPTQLTANSSTWSTRNSVQLPPSNFVDPWSVNTQEVNKRSSLSWQKPVHTPATPTQDSLTSVYGWKQSAQDPAPIEGFQYSGTNRGRMLIKLKIETRTGGHQTLVIHEYDDPTKLAAEFCTYWNMNDFKAPLVRLITIRKNNALRSKQSFK